MVPKWVVRGFQAAFVAVSGAAFCLVGMTAAFLVTGFVSVSPDCVMGHMAPPPGPFDFNLSDNCVKPPGYGPWITVFGVVGAVVGLLIALGLLNLFGRIRSRPWRTKLAV
jgi:hypothetical protein